MDITRTLQVSINVMLDCTRVHGMASAVGILSIVSVIRALRNPCAAGLFLPYLKFLLHRIPKNCGHDSSSCINERKFTSGHGGSDQIRVGGNGETVPIVISSRLYILLHSAQLAQQTGVKAFLASGCYRLLMRLSKYF